MLGVELIYRISEMLNNEIRLHGQVKANNPHIWKNCLHQMSNSTWRTLLETLDSLGQQHPELFTIDNFSTIRTALKTLDRYEGYYDRVLDMKNRHLDHKKLAWKCLMTTREVYCRAINLNLPNEDTSKVQTTFGDIFDS